MGMDQSTAMPYRLLAHVGQLQEVATLVFSKLVTV